MGKKSSFFGLKVSKNLNWAELFEKLLGFYGVGVTYLQYFCGGKKIVKLFYKLVQAEFKRVCSIY